MNLILTYKNFASSRCTLTMDLKNILEVVIKLPLFKYYESRESNNQIKKNVCTSN